MKRQELLHRPAMVSDPCCHGRRRLRGTAQTLMRHAKIIDRPHQEHPLVQRQGLACQRPATTSQGSKPFTERRVEPFDVRRVDHPVALRATSERLDACRRAIHHAALRVNDATTRVAFDHLGDQDVAPGPQPRPPCPVWTGSRKVSRTARMEDTQPSGQTKRGRRVAQRRTRSISRRIRGRSRCALTSPPSHSRVCTLMAIAIQTIPPCCLTRSASACTCLRSRGCSPRYACTAWPCCPERVHQSAIVRSSHPNAATIACTGHPWASNVTTRLTVSAAVRRRSNTVPVVALNVLWHAWQMHRCSCCAWIPILPLPVWPLAGQCRLGQHVVVGSMTLLLALRGNIATRSMSGPPFA